VAAIGNRLVCSHEGIFLPSNNVGNADRDNQLTPRAAILFERPGLSNGLDHVAVASLCFPTPKTRF
jgi:hypothetical protein